MRLVQHSIDPFGVIPPETVLRFSQAELRALDRAHAILDEARNLCAAHDPEFCDSDADYLLAYPEVGLIDVLDLDRENRIHIDSVGVW